MVDTRKSLGMAASALDGAESATVAVVQRSQQQVLEIDFVDARSTTAQADGVVDERFADGTETSLPFDLAVVPDVAHHPGVPVADGVRAAIATTAGPIPVGGTTSAQGFVRTDRVVIPPPAIAAPLLGGRMRAGRAGGVPFEFAMHLLMGSILL